MQFKLKGICVSINKKTKTSKLNQFKRVCKQEINSESNKIKREFLQWLLNKTKLELNKRLTLKTN